MEFKSNYPHISLNMQGQAEITFIAPKSALADLEELKDKELLIKVEKYSKRRSLSQNAYMWVLLGEIAIKLNLSKDEVYKNYIKDYGLFEVVPIKNEAVDMFIRTWKGRGLGWVSEVLKPSKFDNYTNVIAYYGTSVYNSTDMKRIIEAIIEDCKELNISTMSLSDIMLLKNEND